MSEKFGELLVLVDRSDRHAAACEQFLHSLRQQKAGLSACRLLSPQNAALCTNGRNDGPRCSILRWWPMAEKGRFYIYPTAAMIRDRIREFQPHIL
jgi:hypothetical protein